MIPMRRFGWWMVAAIAILVGCSTTPTPEVTPRPTTEATAEAADETAEVTLEPTPTIEQPTEAPTPTDVAPRMAAAAPSGQNLLVALTTSGSPRQLALMDRAGAVLPIMDIPEDATRVVPCGDKATSPDGRFFAFYVGGDAGTLYLMDGANSPVQVDDAEYLVCLGNGTFQFTPDSRRFGYIDFLPGVTREEYPDGVLKLFDAASAGEIAHFDNVTAFDLNNENAIFVSFFTNNDNQADEVAVSLWDGSAVREIATILPSADDCWFTSAAVEFAPDGKAVLVLGQRCSTGNTDTQWQFYTVDPSAGSATLAASDFQPGAFVPFSRNNNAFFSPDGTYAYFTVPDGITAYTVAVAALNLADMTINVPVARQAVFPNFSGAPNASPRLSPDGRWLAMSVTSPDNDNQLVALDLANPATPPITLSAGSRGDLISGFTFTPNSDQVIYVAGGASGADNTLLALDLAAGSERRIARSHFDRDVVLSPDGSAAAMLDWQQVEDPREPLYANLVLINPSDSTTTTLFTGADVVEGRVTNPRTAVPLAWR